MTTHPRPPSGPGPLGCVPILAAAVGIFFGTKAYGFLVGSVIGFLVLVATFVGMGVIGNVIMMRRRD